ncbi:FkbM family methyltransferase, partial [Synechococcus sp. H55.11]
MIGKFSTLPSDSSLEALAAEVKVMQDDQPDAFQGQVREIYQNLSPPEWGYFLEQLLAGSQPISKALDKADFTLARLCQALQSAPHHRRAYLTLRSLVTEGLLSGQQASSAILEAATQLESVEGKGQRQGLQISLKLREIAFELDPLQKDNVEKLLIHAVDSEDDLSVVLYGQALLECLDKQTKSAHSNTVRIEESSQSVKALTLLLDKGYIDLFFAIANSLIPLLQEAQKTAFIGLLSQLAIIFSPDKAKDYDGLYKVEDIIRTEFNQIVGAISYNSASNYYSLIGDRLLALADENKDNLIVYLALLAESLEKLIRTSKSEKIKDIIDKITEHLSSCLLEDWQVTLENLSDSLTIARVILSRVAFCWSYVSDDRSLIRRYQQLGGRILSQTLNLMARQRNFTWLEHWEKQKALYKAHKKPHIGYLGNCFRRHSVGFLSESSLRLQNRGALDVSYYYFWGHSTEEIASHDNLYQRFSSHDHLFFRILPKGTPIPKVVSQAREDQVDIMIFMDSLTIHEANMSAALRCAPIQIGWLGGDAVGLPEFDYFLADPHILPEDAQVDYQEKIIRLPSYCAIDSLDFFPLAKDEFKSKLNVKPYHLLFLTASSAYKRTSECIEAHLRITKEVKNAILIVKVSGEISTVISRYKTKAKELGVDEKVRFLATTKTAEEHRGQLGCVDLILDTFPYTGATHTMEALYMGVPVLTLVGRHYYGRMSYSLLKNIGLEDCITWSVEEFIQRGIQLGNNPEQLN